MKAILKFNLDDEDDRHKYKIYLKAMDMKAALEDIHILFRSLIKYDGWRDPLITITTDDECELVEKIADAVFNIRKEYELIDLD